MNLPEATYIGNDAFSYCKALETVTLPKATDIGESAFYGCNALASVNLPEATYIDYGAFSGCEALETVDLPKATYIGGGAFSDTGGQPLTVTLGAAAPALGTGIFSNVSVSKNVTVRVPIGAAGYDASWQSSFTGGNSYVSVTLENY